MEKLGTLRVNNLNKHFRASNQEVKVLDDINLTVQPGETVVVSGQLALAPGAKVAPQPYAPQNQEKSQSQSSKTAM